VSLQNNNNEIKKRCKILKTYFCDSLSHSLTVLKTLQYTVQDAQKQKNSTDYIQSIVLHEKNSDIITMNYVQILMTYKHFNDELHLHLSISTEQVIMTKLIEIINIQKNI